MAGQPARRKRHRGDVEVLPSGSFRVRVYAGVDPLSGKRHYLRETLPAGPNAAKEAEKARTRLLAEVDERRNPRTSTTVNQLLDRYLSVVEVEESTRTGYESMCRNYIRPVLGELRIGRIDGETLDAFFAELRRCRRRCDRRARTDHHTTGVHDCDRRCKPHTCRPLGGSYIRQIHNVLNGAFTRAVRRRWVGTNPVRQAEAPPRPTPDPQPPTASQAAAIANEAWGDPHWGMLVWLAMTTGARRGELCAGTGSTSPRDSSTSAPRSGRSAPGPGRRPRNRTSDEGSSWTRRPWRGSRHIFAVQQRLQPASAVSS
ncbi:hypothetical protein [Pseudonocardia sp. HH130629-09]|uniref:hypothetical protein n=1 Tax=Pseudonocardia sp. HH130629-09 TaxID=1641402 RepID=UPI00076126DE|nr:hypothetical protein [Pseudonocardia sp. HH130629-09]